MRHKHRNETATEILSEVSQVLSSSLDFDRVSDLVLKESRDALKADHASLFLLDEEMGHLFLEKAKGFTLDEIDNIKVLGSWEVINDQLVRKKKTLIVNDIKDDPIFSVKSLPFSKERLPLKSFIAAPLKNDKGGIIGILIVSNKKKTQRRFNKEDEELFLALSNNISIALLNASLYDRLKRLFISTVSSLTSAIDAKDRYTSGHSERVMKYAYAIGREMNLGEERLENLRLSSLLHDVGKIGVKESILSKPAKLLGYERSEMSQHPIIGAGIVEKINDSEKIIKGILEHHERFDGKGYPRGLKGKDISLEGRIVAVADTYDALTTNRPYQERYSKKDAFLEIKRGTSSQFDPEVVKAFISSFSNHPETWEPTEG